MNHYQDWDPVIIRGKVSKEKEKEKYVKFMGQEIKLPKRSQYSGKTREQKLDETELGTHKRISKDTALTIQKARVAKQYTQKDLAGLINVSTDIISSYESGKAIPDPKIMQKLRRVLGVKL